MKYLKTMCVALAFGSVLVSGCKKDKVAPSMASYTHSEGDSTETIFLHDDGSYIQTEAGKNGPQLEFPARPQTQTVKGKWRLLDMPRGARIKFSGSIDELPKDAVVILENALPFGETSDVSNPYSTTHDRTISAHEFHLN
ncbi:hypothetical protein CCAX7_29990 [Capsulimonas corticalis]|uniref:Uncharacterized protein n=1 Tax=Capsulimonas corticalis TaxID=2219043 RepID=A0A402CSU8_9BACT|nr:hypothetical protein [Capsulimonas corticalis]BDI30948.1 hypothetical protein CCAX7_29990 [Capsulimonas corticalis]